MILFGYFQTLSSMICSCTFDGGVLTVKCESENLATVLSNLVSNWIIKYQNTSLKNHIANLRT